LCSGGLRRVGLGQAARQVFAVRLGELRGEVVDDILLQLGPDAVERQPLADVRLPVRHGGS
jgi:hypothetical protein